jgi:hypothetical protein
MKSMKKGLLIALMIAGFLALAAPPSQGQVAVSFSVFHESLAPHGTWVSVGSYGECWYPSGLSAGWQPYSNGEWIYTDYGWTWVSYDPWGDYPFHYGTWVFEGAYGWVWVPGYVWAPAWVTWSYSDAYVGWAPIPPTLAFGFSGYLGGPVVVSHNYYVFVPTNRMLGANVSTVRVPVARNATILPATRKVTNFAVQGGVVRNTALPVSHIEKVTHTTIQRANISQAKTQPLAIKESPAAKGGKLSVVASAASKKAASTSMKSEGGGQKPLEPKGGGRSMKSESKPMKSESKPMKSETGGQKPLAPKSTSHGKSTSHSMSSEGKPMKSESQPKERTTVHETPPPPQHHTEAKPSGGPAHEHVAPPKPSPKTESKKEKKPPA